MDAITNRSAEDAMQAMHHYLQRNAPVRGHIYGDFNQMRFVEHQPERQDLFGSLWGILLVLVLSLITGGAFFVVYIFYLLVFKDKDPATIEIAAFSGHGGQTVLAVSSNRKKYERRVANWARENL